MSRARVVGIAAVVVLVGTGGAWVAAERSAQQPSQQPVQPTTTPVQRTTLVDGKTVGGTLGHGDTTTMPARGRGTLTWLPVSGATVRRGEPIYRVDEEPVVLLYGDLPAYRTLSTGVSDGPDVEQLERNLRALGYTGFTVDDDYSGYTTAAVREWQEDLGVTETGVVDPDAIVIAPGSVRIDTVDAELGTGVGPGATVLSYTGVRQLVTLEIDPSVRRFAKPGTRVEVTFPDDTTVAGRIRKAETVVSEGSGDEDATTVVEVTIAIPGRKAQRAADRYDSASVDVTFTVDQREDVLAVPVTALVALAKGGYGVEVVDEDTIEVVPVEPGLFAQGLVEVSGDGIDDGTRVVIPS